MIKIFWLWEEENLEENYDENIALEEDKNDVWQVAVDIIENDYEIVILAPVAWIALEDIDLSFKNSILTISWFREKPEIFDEKSIVKNSECFWWRFIRNIILPDNLDFDNIKATMENNLLIISIKKLYFESRWIKINKFER